MSKDLRPEHIDFFMARMKDHSSVTCIEDISTDEFYIYKLFRTGDLSPVIVYLSDAYEFTDAEFLARPKKPRPDYILIALPHASGPESKTCRKEKVGIGKIRALMGALNKRNLWEYVPPEERDETDYL